MQFHKKQLRAWTLQRLMARDEAAKSESYIETRLEKEMCENLDAKCSSPRRKVFGPFRSASR